MGSFKLKFIVISVCGLTAWAYISLTSQSSSPEDLAFEPTTQEQKTVQNFASYLEKNPEIVKNAEVIDHTATPSETTEIDSETFQKISHQVLSAGFNSDEEKAFKLFSENPSKDRIALLTRLLKNDEARLGVTADEKGLAINYLRKQIETDQTLVRNLVDAATSLGNEPDLKPIQSIYIREAAKHVKPGSPEAPQFMALFQSLNLPDFDPTVREVSHQFPEVREMALRRLQTRQIAAEPDPESDPEPETGHDD